MSNKRLQYIKQKYRENNIPIMNFNLFGIRDESGMSKDLINDKLGFFTVDELFICQGTTDPSVYWTTSSEHNKGGTFHLLDGYHKDIWTFGTHKGYKAIVNDYKKCQPTKGWRDENYNFTRDEKDPIVCDYFGINFHRMNSKSIVKKIGKYSSGCQVVQRPNDFNYIMQRAQDSEQEIFSYMLFKLSEMEIV